MPELVLAIVRIGIVVLLWFFVLAAVRVIRTDIYGSRAARPARLSAPRSRNGRRPQPLATRSMPWAVFTSARVNMVKSM